MSLTRKLVLAAAALLVTGAVFVAAAVRRGYDQLPTITAEAERAATDGLAFADLPQRWQRVLLAVEDPAFRTHAGVDFSTPGAGATTLTQALVKRHYYGGHFERGFLRYRKVEQSVLALVLDRGMSKDRQLDLFLDTAYFGTHEGDPVVGFPSAARVYFGQDVETLSDAAFISLVAALVGPNEYTPGTAANAERSGRIERLLAGSCVPAGHGDVYLSACAV